MHKALPGLRPLLVTLPFRVQTYDIDFAGHVNNGVYVRWLEDLRTELLRVHYPLERFLAEKVLPVLASSHVRYLRPIRLFEEPVGRMWCTRIGRATLSLEAEVRVDGQVCASATQRGILLCQDSGKPARMPVELLEQFQRDNVAP